VITLLGPSLTSCVAEEVGCTRSTFVFALTDREFSAFDIDRHKSRPAALASPLAFRNVTTPSITQDMEFSKLLHKFLHTPHDETCNPTMLPLTASSAPIRNHSGQMYAPESSAATKRRSDEWWGWPDK
jgi:hypothetical protein